MQSSLPRPVPETVGETTNFTSQDFKATVGRFMSGVTVVTTRLGALRAGITVNAFCSVSLEPPLVLICIDRSSRVHDVLVQAGIFAANLLTAEQEAVSRCFAGYSAARWEGFCGCATHIAATGAPIFDESLGFVDCRIVDVFPAGDHSIIVGSVEALGACAGEPLLYYRGRYGPPRRRSRSTRARTSVETAHDTAHDVRVATDPVQDAMPTNTPQQPETPKRVASARHRGRSARNDTTSQPVRRPTSSTSRSSTSRSSTSRSSTSRSGPPEGDSA